VELPPGVPVYPHDEPGCFDATLFDWLKQSLASRQPNVNRVGVSYMYGGAWVPDLMRMGPAFADKTFNVGPHIMIVTPRDADIEAFSHDGSNGQIYFAHLPERKGLYLVIPIREWEQK
jgi:hypothetical protein